MQRFQVLDVNGGLKTTGTPGPPGAAGPGGGDLNPATHLAAIVAPVNADFSWVNQGSASIVDDTTSVVLIGAATGAGQNFQIRVKTAPAPPYVITALLCPCLFAKAVHAYGLVFRESSSGKLHDFMVSHGDLGLTTPDIGSYKRTSPTAFSATYLSSKVPGPVAWLRIADDGTNRICSLSADGAQWIVFHTIGRTDFLTANQVGFFVSSENVATPNFAPILRVSSWKET